MTYDEYDATEEDLLAEFRAGYLTEGQLCTEMEGLQAQWEEEGEE